MPTARTQTRSAATRRAAAGRRTRPTAGAAGRMSRTNARATTSARARKLARRKPQPPPSLASKIGHNAMAGLVTAGGAARGNKSKVALLAGLGAAGAAFLKRKRGDAALSDSASEPAPGITIADDPEASVPVNSGAPARGAEPKSAA